MADRHTTVFGDQIDITALGAGLKKDVDDNLQVYVDDVTLELATIVSGENDGLQVKDLGISTAKLADEAVTEGKLDVYNSPSDGYVLSWNDSEQKFEWVEVDVTDAVLEADVIVNEIPTGLINSSNTSYTIANAPVTGTVAVYLNGLLQAPGVGLDYTISGQTITFVKAPRTNSDLYVSYIIDN